MPGTVGSVQLSPTGANSVIFSAEYRGSPQPRYMAVDSWRQALDMALEDPRKLTVIRWLRDDWEGPLTSGE